MSATPEERNRLNSKTPEQLKARLEKQLALLKKQIKQRRAVEEALRQESKRVKLLQEVAAAANTAETLASAFQITLDQICAYTSWSVGIVYFLSTDNTTLLSADLYHCRDEEKRPLLIQASKQSHFTAEVEWVGQVFREGKSRWLHDLRQGPAFGHKNTLLEMGMGAGFAFPILIKTKVVAVLEFFSPDLAQPQPELLEALAYIGTQLGHVVERIQNEQALKQSQALLASAEKIARLGSWEWEIATNRVTWSSEMYRIYGLDPATFGASYQAFMILLHPDDRAQVDQIINQAIQNKSAFTFYHRIIRPDGEIRTLLAQGQPILNEGGELIRMIGTGQDITETRQAEIRLEYQTQQLIALNKMGQTVTATLDLERVFDRVLAELLLLLKADGIFILLLDGKDLVFVATNEIWLPAVKGKRVPASGGVAGEVLRTGEATWVYGAEVERRIYKEISETAGFQPQVLMVAPLRFHGDMIGVMEAIHHKEEGFAEADLRLLEAAAAWTAIAIGNAGLFEAQQQARQTAESLRDANLKLTQTLDLPTIVDTLLDHLEHLINSDRSCILFPENDQLLVWKARGDWQKHQGTQLEISRVPALTQIYSQKHSVVVADTAQVENWPLVLNLEHPTRSWLGVPLLTGDTILGIFVAGHALPHKFNERHRLVAEALTGQAAIALQNARLFAEIQVNQKRLHRLNQQVVTAQEEERRRVSRELHDEAGQALTALKITLEIMRSDVQNEEIAQQLADAVALTHKTMEHIRLLAHALRPPVLDTLGLNMALEGLCNDFAQRTRLNVQYRSNDLPHLPDPVAIGFYRFLQEGLTNIIKHANAQNVVVHLNYTLSTRRVCLTISDDGNGFPSPKTSSDGYPGLGLAGMQERFELLGGEVMIESHSGQGTRLMACTTL